LTVLYPEEFTVFDVNVCGEVGFAYKPWNDRGFSASLWQYYESYQQAVINQTPSETVLRDKDRFLFGRYVYKELERACAD
jgi:hypothetical protein